MEKPSEIAVSNLKADVEYYNNQWKVKLTWFYDSADPADYLVVCRTDKSDEIYEIESDYLKPFKTHLTNDTWKNPGKYTYTVYTVGNGYSTSASASITVNCEYPSYNVGNGGSSGSSELSGSRWTYDDQYIQFYGDGTADYYNGTSTQTLDYSYNSGSGEFGKSYAGQFMHMFYFTISGDELSLDIAGGMYATFYKN